MHRVLLPIHLAFAGLWLGYVLTEVLFERAPLNRGRAQAAKSGAWDEFTRLDGLQHRIGAVVLLAIVVALGLGISLFASGSLR